MRNVKPKQDMYAEGSPVGIKRKKSEPIYPRVRFDLDTVPEAKKWEVGKSYKVEMELKMVGLSISRFDNSAEFEIRKIGTNDAAIDTSKEEVEKGDDD